MNSAPKRQHILVLVLISLLSFGLSEFLPERLVIVDQYKKQNFLVRGNLPVKDQKFQIKELQRQLEKITGLEKDSYKLIVYNLMNSLTAKQTKGKYIEDKFFEQHAGNYIYKNNAVLGSFVNPDSLPAFLRNIILPFYEYLSIDGLPQMLTQFRTYIKRGYTGDDLQKDSQMDSTQGLPTIVYFHCSQGVDRTGYVASAYNLRYKEKSFQQTYKENMRVLKGVRTYMHFNTYQGIEWYCLYLGRSQQQCLQNLQK